MKKLIFVILAVFLLMCGCENSEVCEVGENWRITKNTIGNSSTYDYIICDNDDNVILKGESKQKPEITVDGYSYICIYIGDSSEYTVQYVCPYSDLVSEVFENPLAWGNGDIAVISDSEIIIRSALGTGSRSYELPLSENMTAGKAILGAAFDEYADNLIVIYVPANDNKHCTAVLPVNLLDWENNPIDRFYDKYAIEAFSTLDEAVAAMCEKEIWKAEFDNAYQMLRGMANPKVDSLQDDIDDSVEEFEEYVKAYAEIYMAYEWSDAYFSDCLGWSDEIFYGTGASGAATACEAELYRQATLDLYRMMNDRFASVDEAFVFDEHKYLCALSEAGISVTRKNEN